MSSTVYEQHQRREGPQVRVRRTIAASRPVCVRAVRLFSSVVTWTPPTSAISSPQNHAKCLHSHPPKITQNVCILIPPKSRKMAVVLIVTFFFIVTPHPPIWNPPPKTVFNITRSPSLSTTPHLSSHLFKNVPEHSPDRSRSTTDLAASSRH